MNRVLVIGATGNIGRCVVDELLSIGASVRAMTRNPDSARLPAGVESVRGDLTVPETLNACLDSIDAVFLVWTAPPGAVAAAIKGIARRARRIVFLSAPIKTPHPFFQQPNPLRDLTAHIEEQIEDSGLQWTFLRPGMLASNALNWWAPQIRAGDLVRWPYLTVPTAPIDERDIAAVAVCALTQEGHAGADYVLTGPQSMTQFEQIATIGAAIGRSLRIEEMTPEDFRREWTTIFNQIVVGMLLNAWAAGAGRPAHVTSTVAEVTGKAARSFREWACDHASAFRPAV
jgi:uncharacterized protein YbjT (DUF2867 family)